MYHTRIFSWYRSSQNPRKHPSRTCFCTTSSIDNRNQTMCEREKYCARIEPNGVGMGLGSYYFVMTGRGRRQHFSSIKPHPAGLPTQMQHKTLYSSCTERQLLSKEEIAIFVYFFFVFFSLRCVLCFHRSDLYLLLMLPYGDAATVPEIVSQPQSVVAIRTNLTLKKHMKSISRSEPACPPALYSYTRDDVL